ncbi:MAG: nucleotidyl transferase AbiEii/AbiGii toxin family protein [Planctomycetes bacterium]|nr:nucleotidyl transferase AbiEii/AbiGii toxin family protein [Planctomycetota bacterium]
MKDFFDVWVLAGNFPFHGRILADAIRSTFMQRETNIEAAPACFSDRFVQTPAKAAQWVGFLRNSRVEVAPAEFAEVVAHARNFLQPVAQALSVQRTFEKIWSEGGPWR